MINLTRMWSCPIKSLSLKLSEKITLSDAFVDNLVSTHRVTLAHLSLRNLALSKESALKICKECTELETLKLGLSAKDTVSTCPSPKPKSRNDLMLYTELILERPSPCQTASHHYGRGRLAYPP